MAGRKKERKKVRKKRGLIKSVLVRKKTDWAPEESEVPPGQEGGTTHLWAESWDDDDTSEDFSKQLR